MLRERLNKDLLIFDGGFGSQLQELGMKAGEIPEYYNIEIGRASVGKECRSRWSPYH